MIAAVEFGAIRQYAKQLKLPTLGGQFALGSLLGTSTGTVAGDGTLSLAGTMIAGTTTMTFQNFVITSSAAGHMTGTFQAVFGDSTTTGWRRCWATANAG